MRVRASTPIRTVTSTPLVTAFLAGLLVLFALSAGTAGSGTGVACRLSGLDIHGTCSLWERSHGALGTRGEGRAVVVDPAGDRVFASGSWGFVVAYDATTGDLLWEHRRGVTERSLALSPDGAVLYAGGSESGAMRLSALHAAGGTLLWERNLPLGHGLNPDVAVAPDGSRVYAATREGAAPAVAALDPEGGLLWSVPLPGESRDWVVDLTPAPDGVRVYATVTRGGGAEVAALSAADGSVAWTTPTGVGVHQPQMRGTDLSPDGSRLFVAGVQAGLEPDDRSWDYRIIALDTPDGSVAWDVRYDDPDIAGSFESAWAVAVSPDGTAVHVTGLGSGLGGPDDFLTLSLEADTGRLRWVARFDQPFPSHDDALAGIVVSPDGARVYVGGTSTYGLSLVSYEADTGNEAWRMTSVSGFVARSLAVSPDSEVLYVTGSARETDVTAAYHRDLERQSW